MCGHLQQAREIHVELQEDYGATPAMNVQDVANLLDGGYSHQSIEELYRNFMYLRRKEAFDKLGGLRDTYGRCRLIKEDTVLLWMDAHDTEQGMEAKYRKAVECEERVKRIDTQLKGAASQLKTVPNHTMDDIKNALDSYGQESDAEIARRVTR